MTIQYVTQCRGTTLVRRSPTTRIWQRIQKLSVEDAAPLMPEEFETLVRKLRREPDIIDLFMRLAGADPLPPR